VTETPITGARFSEALKRFRTKNHLKKYEALELQRCYFNMSLGAGEA